MQANHMKPTIYYSCRLPMSAGGELVNFQHVASLRKLGWRAAVLLDEQSQVQVPRQPYPVPMVQFGQAFRFRPLDVLVLPEVCQPQTWQDMARQACRVVVHNQNPYYSFRGFPSTQALNAHGLWGALCCSGFTRDTLARWGCTLPWQVVRPFVLPTFALAARQPGVQRRRQVAFMPRKRGGEAYLLQSIFRSTYPQLADVPWVEIKDMARPQVARVMAESLVFASFSQFEGLGLPPLEAMAAGCLVAGFTGGGGEEYATPANGRWVPEGDLDAFAAALAADLQADEAQVAARRAAGEATAAAFDQSHFEAQLDAAWRHLLAAESPLYRVQTAATAGRAEGEDDVA